MSVTPSGTVSACSGASVKLTANFDSKISYQWKNGANDITGATNFTYTTAQAGNYKVVESNSFDCHAISSNTKVTLLNAPVATITPPVNLDLCETNPIDLQATAAVGQTYQWKRNGSKIQGATDQIYSATAAGTYKVVAFNSSNGCSKTSSGVALTKLCREISSNPDAYTRPLSIYPNPSDGKFTIELKLDNEETSQAKAELINIFDQAIPIDDGPLTVENGKLIKAIQLRDLADGVYLLKVIVNDVVYATQINLQK